MADFLKDFVPGHDIIYGIGAWITRYIIFYESGGTTKYQESDKIPQGVWDSAHQKKERDMFAINTLNMAITNAQYSGLQTDMFPSTVNETEYIKKLKTATSTIAEPVKVDTLKKSNVNLDQTNTGQVHAAAKDIAIRRSSKFGIAYVTEHLKGKVHYVLDGVDLDKVLDKATITNGSNYEKVPIVTSELRYLFRNWGRFKGTGKVLFWKNYAPSSPPWSIGTLEQKRKWAAYALERLIKFAAKAKLDELGGAKSRDLNKLKVNLAKLGDPRSNVVQNANNILKQYFPEEFGNPESFVAFFHKLDWKVVNRDEPDWQT